MWVAIENGGSMLGFYGIRWDPVSRNFGPQSCQLWGNVSRLPLAPRGLTWCWLKWLRRSFILKSKAPSWLSSIFSILLMQAPQTPLIRYPTTNVQRLIYHFFCNCCFFRFFLVELKNRWKPPGKGRWNDPWKRTPAPSIAMTHRRFTARTMLSSFLMMPPDLQDPTGPKPDWPKNSRDEWGLWVEFGNFGEDEWMSQWMDKGGGFLFHRMFFLLHLFDLMRLGLGSCLTCWVG